MNLGRLPLERKTGEEPFRDGEREFDLRLVDYWRWSASDLVSNAQRGTLAEFLVAHALGVDGGVRTEWDAVDLRTRSGAKIEVKASGYVQSWDQPKYSSISFGIAPKQAWDAGSNTSSDTPVRSADAYVFAVHAHREQESINPLDLSQWEFHVLSTARIQQECGDQKTLSLGALERLSSGSVPFEDLEKAIESEVGQSSCPKIQGSGM